MAVSFKSFGAKQFFGRSFGALEYGVATATFEGHYASDAHRVGLIKMMGITNARWQINTASYTTPIVLAVANHSLQDGDRVKVSGVLGNTAANGWWTVANRTDDDFELSGSVGNAAYTGGGYVDQLSGTQQRWPCSDIVNSEIHRPNPTEVGVGRVWIQTDSDPSANDFSLDLLGRPHRDSDWMLIKNYTSAISLTNNGEGDWALATPDVNIAIYPEMRWRLNAVVGSTNKIEAWLQWP
ncbi:MAG: hypothetical protein GY701_28815 [Sulfitobacter sp.]|nr:hypothetical protein [Sulfitobacter sp.]